MQFIIEPDVDLVMSGHIPAADLSAENWLQLAGVLAIFSRHSRGVNRL
jgi:hypothetical protein